MEQEAWGNVFQKLFSLQKKKKKFRVINTINNNSNNSQHLLSITHMPGTMLLSRLHVLSHSREDVYRDEIPVVLSSLGYFSLSYLLSPITHTL